MKPSHERGDRLCWKASKSGAAMFQGAGEPSVVKDIDVLLFCTGYSYDFPFLPADCGVAVHDSKQVAPLFEHVFSITDPTLAFVGLPWKVRGTIANVLFIAKPHRCSRRYFRAA